MRALLARGARQELQDNCGETALHRAAKGGLAGIVGLLCAAPGAAAALALRDFSGKTPLEHAEAGGKEACAALLRAPRQLDAPAAFASGGGAVGGIVDEGEEDDEDENEDA